MQIPKIKKLINTAYLIRTNSLQTEGEFSKGNLLFKELRNISCKNLSYEFYLTDLVEIFEKKYKVGCYFFDDYSRLIGVNDQNSLNKAKEIYKKMSNN
mgnify:CR=1 FL=1